MTFDTSCIRGEEGLLALPPSPKSPQSGAGKSSGAQSSSSQAYGTYRAENDLFLSHYHLFGQLGV